MGDSTTLTDEEIRTTWTKAPGSTGPENSADPDSSDSDGTDGDSDGTDGDSDGTDGDSGSDSDGTDS